MNEVLISTSAPLLFLVIIKLADTAREFDLKHIASQKGWETRNGNVILELGMFSLIHHGIIIILMIMFTWLFRGDNGNVAYQLLTGEISNVNLLLSILTVLIWLLLPVIEVSEYEDILDPEYGIPGSFLTHIISTCISVISLILSMRFHPNEPPIDQGTILQMLISAYNPNMVFSSNLVGGILVMIGVFVSQFGALIFTFRLEKEILNQDNQQRQLNDFG